MKLNRMRKLALLAAFVLIGGAAALAGGGTWVSADRDHVYDLHANRAFFPDGATELDVADLADGETRIVGEGAKRVSVSREGDMITIQRTDPAEDTDIIDIVCQAGKDSCRILTFDEDPEQVIIIVQKTRQCVDGEGDCEFGLHTISGEHGNQFVIRKQIECVNGGKCADVTTNVMPFGGDHAVIELIGEHGLSGDDVMVLSADGAGNMMFFGHDKVTLRCPEGDTTMHVELEEAEDVFLCPKHSQPLEKLERPMLHRIKRHEIHGPDDNHK